MNIFPSRNKQNISTDVYIDGVKISATRIDVDSTMRMPFGLINGYLCSYYGTSICLACSDYVNKGGGLYVLNGREWVYYPSDFHAVSSREHFLIQYNNDLHLFRDVQGELYDYIWNGETFTENSSINSVYIHDYPSIIEYHNELYCIASPHGNLSDRLVKLDITNQTFSVIANVDTSATQLVVYNDEIHILGGTSHYKWNGTEVSSVSTIPIDMDRGIIVTWNGSIHIFNGYYKHYSWNGNIWEEEPNTMFLHSNGGHDGGIVYNNKIYLFGRRGIEGIEQISSVPPKDITIS